MQILTLTGHTQFDVLVTSPTIIKVDYHWCGRSVMCAGLGCPMCEYTRPKTYGYLTGVHQREHRVIEVCPSFYNGALSAVPLLSDQGMRGYVLRARRGSKKTPWRFEPVIYKPDLVPGEFDEWLVPEAIASLYRIPAVPREGGVAAFLNRCAETQRAVLQSCVIE